MKEVRAGEYLYEQNDTVKYIYKMNQEKPVLIARWAFGILERHTIDDNKKLLDNMIKNGDTPTTIIKFLTERIEFLENVELHYLMPIEKDTPFHTLIKYLEVDPYGFISAEQDEEDGMEAIHIEIRN